MDINTEENRKILINFFPGLKEDENYELLSNQTPIYNCIAWAMGFNDRWVDIYSIPGHWWPDGVRRSNSPDALIDAFVALGFELVDDGNFEEGYDKVALYQKDNQWTHASRIESDDIEYSKFGVSFDGTHSHNVFSDSLYGNEYAYMRRSVTKRALIPAIKSGSILLNLDNLFF